jgi:two-component system response regulator PilR (NtrC family)
LSAAFGGRFLDGHFELSVLSPMSRTNQILIVDDNPHMTSLLAETLEFFDYRGIAATDGEEALHKLKEDSFDMVITDLRMPRMGGMDLLRTIKDGFPYLPVVVITGFDAEASKGDALSAHADGFLSKPFKVDEIKELLQKHLGYQG